MHLDPTKTAQTAEHKHTAPLLCCAFDPTGRFVIAGGRDRGLVCLDVAAGALTPLEGHETWTGHATRAGGELVLTSDFAGRVCAWDCTGDAPRARWSIAAHASTIYALAASGDGQLCATGDRAGAIRIWRTSDGRLLHELPPQPHPIYALAFHPDGRQLFSADRQPQKPRLKTWEFASGKELHACDVPALSAYRRYEDIEWGGIRGLAVSADGQTIVACGENEYAGPACALLLDAASGEIRRKLTSALKNAFYYAVRYHPQGFLLTCGGDVGKGEFCTWATDQDAPLATVATPGPCTALDIHPDGSRLVVAQTIGKGSYPDSGTLTLYAWAEATPAS